MSDNEGDAVVRRGALRRLDDRFGTWSERTFGFSRPWRRRAISVALAAIPVLAVGLVSGKWKVAGVAGFFVAVQLFAVELGLAVRRAAVPSPCRALLRWSWSVSGVLALGWIVLRITLAGPRWLRLAMGAAAFALLYVSAVTTWAARLGPKHGAT